MVFADCMVGMCCSLVWSLSNFSSVVYRWIVVVISVIIAELFVLLFSEIVNLWVWFFWR